MNFSYPLSQGTLVVDIKKSALADPKTLFDVAERQNPNRAFIFVSKVIGRYTPTKPSTMLEVFDTLASMISPNLEGRILFLGLAEAAITLSSGVHRSYTRMHPDKNCTLLTTTRHEIESGHLYTKFSEDHSHASQHLIYQPSANSQPYDKIVIIDDEITTGKTLSNLLKSITESNLISSSFAEVITLTDWSHDRQTEYMSNLNVKSLIYGKYAFEANPATPKPITPNVSGTSSGKWNQARYHTNFGRLGIDTHNFDLTIPDCAYDAERILVVGTGEFTWMPFLLAEKIEKEGKDVEFVSMTRSPILPGSCITNKFTATDTYGIGIENYLYNVNPDEFDLVIFCSEAQEDLIDSNIIKQLKATPVNLHKTSKLEAAHNE